MALILCPECGHSISDKATACPNCGFPLQNSLEEKKIQKDKVVKELRVCPKCKATMNDDAFCRVCGSKYKQTNTKSPSTMVTKFVKCLEVEHKTLDEKVKQRLQKNMTFSEKRTCISCGTLLDEEDLFCMVCGAKYEAAKETSLFKEVYEKIGDYEQERSFVCPTCGKPIDVDDVFCMFCGTNVEITYSIDAEHLAKEKTERLEAERKTRDVVEIQIDPEEAFSEICEEEMLPANQEEHHEGNRGEKETAPKKNKHTLAIVLINLAVIGGGIFASITYLFPYMKYQKAFSLAEQGQYSEARQIFVELSDYSNSEIWVQDCDFQIAKQLVEEKKYDEAIKIYKDLGSYKYASLRIREVEFLQAQDNCLNGNYVQALDWLENNTNYPGAENLISKCYEGKLLYAIQNKNYASILQMYNNDLGQKLRENKPALNTMNVGVALAYKNQENSKYYDMYMERVVLKNGFLEDVSDALKKEYSDWEKAKTDAAQKAEEEKKAQEAARRQERINQFNGDGMSVRFTKKFETVNKRFDFFDITQVLAKKENNNVCFIVYYNSSHSFTMSCFNPPNGSLFMKHESGSAGTHKLEFVVSIKDLKQTKSITMKNFAGGKVSLKNTSDYIFINTSDISELKSFL